MGWLLTLDGWIALSTLTLLEIVLGIDNLIFIAIITSKLPNDKQVLARRLGLLFAIFTRLSLLVFLLQLMRLTQPLFNFLAHTFSGRDLILIGGGLFLLAKSTLEIHNCIEGDTIISPKRSFNSLLLVALQIAMTDIIFSLDSLVTAIGLVDTFSIMATAIILAIVMMLFLAKSISQIIQKHPTLKMLALSFLLLIGLSLVAEGLDLHLPKGYLYFAMAFSIFVEIINLRIRTQTKTPLHLRNKFKNQ